MTYTPATVFIAPWYCLSSITASESTLIPTFLAFDPQEQKFRFSEIGQDHLDLSGETFTEYSVTLNYRVFSFYDPVNPSYDADQVLTWTVINPCTDPHAVVWKNEVQETVPRDAYSGEPIIVISPFDLKVFPTFCPCRIRCASIYPSDKLTCLNYLDNLTEGIQE